MDDKDLIDELKTELAQKIISTQLKLITGETDMAKIFSLIEINEAYKNKSFIITDEQNDKLKRLARFCKHITDYEE